MPLINTRCRSDTYKLRAGKKEMNKIGEGLNGAQADFIRKEV